MSDESQDKVAQAEAILPEMDRKLSELVEATKPGTPDAVREAINLLLDTMEHHGNSAGFDAAEKVKRTIEELAAENAALKAELAAQREEKLMWYGRCASLANDVLATESDLYHAHGMHWNLAFDYLALERELALYKEAISVLRKWEQDTAIRLECCGCEYLEKMKECPVYDNPDCPPNAGTDEAVIQAALSEARAQLAREALDAQCADTGHTEAAIRKVEEDGTNA